MSPASSISPRIGLAKRLLIFGLVGPAGTCALLTFSVRHAEHWWWPRPSIYLVELATFLLCALLDHTFSTARGWERLVVTTFGAFLISGLACALAYGAVSAWVFGLYAPVFAAACSVLASASVAGDNSPIPDA